MAAWWNVETVLLTARLPVFWSLTKLLACACSFNLQGRCDFSPWVAVFPLVPLALKIIALFLNPAVLIQFLFEIDHVPASLNPGRTRA
jgi:hypothetical protein